jgi:hypothetical protein
MTIDAARAGLAVGEVELPLRHRATGRDLAGFLHRGRQLAEAVLACAPQGTNYRGNRLPVLGWALALGGARAPSRVGVTVALVALVGLADDVWSGPERGLRAHLRAGRTTGVLKLLAVPLAGAWATRSLAGGVLVGLAANALNQLDTKPGRALKAFLLADLALGARAGRPYLPGAVLALPYDLRERMLLGDTGSNALGALLGLEPVVRDARAGKQVAILAALAALNLAGDRVSLGAAIERTPLLSTLDRAGRLWP